MLFFEPAWRTFFFINHFRSLQVHKMHKMVGRINEINRTRISQREKSIDALEFQQW